MELTLTILLLALEPGLFTLVQLYPKHFKVLSDQVHPNNPVQTVYLLSLLLKVFQFGVISYQIIKYSPVYAHSFFVVSGFRFWLAMIITFSGALLNIISTFRLGKNGTYYGAAFGYRVHREGRFPYALTTHPQFIGLCLMVWGLFLLMNFPHRSWWRTPLVFTVLYMVAAFVEQHLDSKTIKQK